jgi:hypothetical protein
MEPSDSAPTKVGVVCSLEELQSGQLRVVLDDVRSESKSTPGGWSHHVLFTHKDFEAQELDDLALSEKELAGLGFSILARLVAYRKRPFRT